MGISPADQGQVVLTKEEYDYLVKCEKELSALHAGGVDNWEWYDESLKDILDDDSV